MKFSHDLLLVLQPAARVKDSQAPLKNVLAMHKKINLGLGIISTFLIN